MPHTPIQKNKKIHKSTLSLIFAGLVACTLSNCTIEQEVAALNITRTDTKVFPRLVATERLKHDLATAPVPNPKDADELNARASHLRTRAQVLQDTDF